MPEFSHLSNPLDLTWAGLYDPKVAEGCAKAMGELDGGRRAGAGAGRAHRAWRASRPGVTPRCSPRSRAAREAAGKPLVAVTNLSDEPHPELARVARETGVPYLRGTREGLAAIARYAQWATRRQRALRPIATNEKEIEAAAQKLLPFRTVDRMPAEHEARAILASYGIAGPKEQLRRDRRRGGEGGSGNRLSRGAEGHGARHDPQVGRRPGEAAARLGRRRRCGTLPLAA